MKQEARKVYFEVLQALYESMEDDEECQDFGEYEIIMNILEEGAAGLRQLAPGLNIKTHQYTTVRHFELTVTPITETQLQDDQPVEEPQVKYDPTKPVVPTEGGGPTMRSIKIR